jgi:hypothetical protein
MIAGVMDWLVQSLRLGAESGVLGRALMPLSSGMGRLRVVAVSPLLVRPLRLCGYEVLGLEALDRPPRPDAICALCGPEDLGPLLSGWARAVRPGGMVVLVTRRGRVARSLLCAAMLHAGLAGITQRGAGATLITTGLSAGDRQKTCDEPAAVRIGQSA